MYKNQKSKSTSPTTGENAVKGVKNFLKSKGLDENDYIIVVSKYINEENPSIPLDLYLTSPACEYIQKDFGKFVKWFKKTYK